VDRDGLTTSTRSQVWNGLGWSRVSARKRVRSRGRRRRGRGTVLRRGRGRKGLEREGRARRSGYPNVEDGNPRTQWGSEVRSETRRERSSLRNGYCRLQAPVGRTIRSRSGKLPRGPELRTRSDEKETDFLLDGEEGRESLVSDGVAPGGYGFGQPTWTRACSWIDTELGVRSVTSPPIGV
jgi:hypothetical protein